MAALVTGGTITIKNVSKTAVSAFLSVLNKMGASYEFQGDDLTVWYGGETFSPVEVTSSPAPGFITDWLPALTVLLTQVKGESTLTDTIYLGKWDFVRDLNRMGAKINLNEDSVVIQGPTSFYGVTLDIENIRAGNALLLATLCSETSCDLRGTEYLSVLHENLLEKLQKLGAKILILDKNPSKTPPTSTEDL